MKSRMINLLFLCITLFNICMLTGCSLLSPVKTDTPNKYIINKVPESVPTKKTRYISLLVAVPETRAIYDTTQMAYTTRPYQVAYFSKNQWAENPSQMLHPLLVQTLQNTHYFHTIVTPPFTGRYDYALNTHILELKQDFTYRVPMLKMAVRVQLIRMSTNQVIATKQIAVEQPIPQGTPYGGVFAANHASDVILQQIASFCLETIR